MPRARSKSTRRNIITTVDGIKFHSKKEAARYCDLKLLENFGAIKDLKLQVKFPLWVEGVFICNYFADFTYYDAEKQQNIVEDVKGYQEPIFKLKWKLVQALYPNKTYLLT